MDVLNGSLGKFVVVVEPRQDGGLRAYSDDVPGFVLSHQNPALVMQDIIPVLEAIVSVMKHRSVRVSILPTLGDQEMRDSLPKGREQREYIAIAA